MMATTIPRVCSLYDVHRVIVCSLYAANGQQSQLETQAMDWQSMKTAMRGFAAKTSADFYRSTPCSFQLPGMMFSTGESQT